MGRQDGIEVQQYGFTLSVERMYMAASRMSQGNAMVDSNTSKGSSSSSQHRQDAVPSKDEEASSRQAGRLMQEDGTLVCCMLVARC